MLADRGCSALQCYWEIRKRLMKFDPKPLPDANVIKPDEKVGGINFMHLKEISFFSAEYQVWEVPAGNVPLWPDQH